MGGMLWFECEMTPIGSCVRTLGLQAVVLLGNVSDLMMCACIPATQEKWWGDPSFPGDEDETVQHSETQSKEQNTETTINFSDT